MIGVKEALKFFIILTLCILAIKIGIDLSEGKNIYDYFNVEFVINFISQPVVWGAFLLLSVVSSLNQLVKVSRNVT